ncbi:hypothetical protein ILYODFUR_014489 [Ilyodon furcidens]|uniref:Uncharacterized protein n=1 Tax=Ilyodon furcidens TaxID=33524 RepID=A0ABV0TIU2_9TELE
MGQKKCTLLQIVEENIDLCYTELVTKQLYRSYMWEAYFCDLTDLAAHTQIRYPRDIAVKPGDPQSGCYLVGFPPSASFNAIFPLSVCCFFYSLVCCTFKMSRTKACFQPSDCEMMSLRLKECPFPCVFQESICSKH